MVIIESLISTQSFIIEMLFCSNSMCKTDFVHGFGYWWMGKKIKLVKNDSSDSNVQEHLHTCTRMQQFQLFLMQKMFQAKVKVGSHTVPSFFFSVNKTNKWQIISFKIFWEISCTYYGKSAKSHKPENVGWIPGEAQVFHILLLSFVRANTCMPCITHLTNWTLLGDAQDISTCHLHKLFGSCSSGTLWQNIAANFQMS